MPLLNVNNDYENVGKELRSKIDKLKIVYLINCHKTATQCYFSIQDEP